MKRATNIECRRLDRLHAAFLQVRDHVSRGATVAGGLRRIRHRHLKRPFRKYAITTLRRLFVRWRLDPQPATLARHYKPGPRRVLSQSVITEMLRRLRAQPAVSIAAMVAEMIRAGPLSPPVSLRTLRRAVCSRLPISWWEQRRRRAAALREIAALDAMLAAPPENKPRRRKSTRRRAGTNSQSARPSRP